jgi:hypothetical protein
MCLDRPRNREGDAMPRRILVLLAVTFILLAILWLRALGWV